MNAHSSWKIKRRAALLDAAQPYGLKFLTWPSAVQLNHLVVKNETVATGAEPSF